MSYKIEITADSISELTGKLLALAAATQPNMSDPVMPEVKEAVKPKRTGKAATSASTAAGTGSNTTTETAAEASEASATSDEGNAAGVETSQSTCETSATSPATSSVSDVKPEPISVTTSNTAPPSETAKPLDFDKDVAPIVLAAVKQRGKEWVQEILAQFGAARASQVPDDQMQELVDAITAGLE